MAITIVQADCIDFLQAQPPNSIDLIVSSPPYCDARTYGIDAVYQCQEWVDWMLRAAEAALPSCKGLIAWVVAGVQRECNYWPAPEGLVWEWYKRGHYQWSPSVWWKVDVDEGGTGIPGSGGKQGLRKDWEYVLMFRRDKALAWADNTACGHPPVCEEVGGAMSNRTAEGRRINQTIGNVRANISRKERWAGKMPPVGANGQDGEQKVTTGRPFPKLANPGNVLPLIVKARVGGGHIGSHMAHEGEAPFPERLAEFFVLSFCPPGGVVCDPFSGSGTTATVAKRHGRNFVGCDIRQSQVELGLKRVAQETPPLFV